MTADRTQTGVLPVADATREEARHGGEIVWVVKRCPLCRRRHTHLADPLLTSVVIPARCNPSRFYQLREVEK